MWRTSHIGGHRFAPTLIDFPEGRYWGHLEPDALEKLVLRKGFVSELGRFYRGWAGLSGKFEQIAEREIFVREGWEWTRYLKSGRTLKVDENEDRAEVRIEYATPGGSILRPGKRSVSSSRAQRAREELGRDPARRPGGARPAG